MFALHTLCPAATHRCTDAAYLSCGVLHTYAYIQHFNINIDTYTNTYVAYAHTHICDRKVNNKDRSAASLRLANIEELTCLVVYLHTAARRNDIFAMSSKHQIQSIPHGAHSFIMHFHFFLCGFCCLLSDAFTNIYMCACICVRYQPGVVICFSSGCIVKFNLKLKCADIGKDTEQTRKLYLASILCNTYVRAVEKLKLIFIIEAAVVL